MVEVAAVAREAREAEGWAQLRPRRRVMAAVEPEPIAGREKDIAPVLAIRKGLEPIRVVRRRKGGRGRHQLCLPAGAHRRPTQVTEQCCRPVETSIPTSLQMRGREGRIAEQ